MSKTAFLTLLVLLTAKCYPQKNYSVFILNNSKNYFVKNDAETSNIYSFKNFINADTIPKTEKKDDAFSRLMAGVVNDTAILYNSYVDVIPKKDTAKSEPAKKAVSKADNKIPPVSKKDTAKSEVVKKQVAKVDSSFTVSLSQRNKTDSFKKETAVINKEEKKIDSPQTQRRQVFAEKLFEQKNDSSLQLIYAAINKDGKRDTVFMVIPLEKEAINKPQTDTIKKIAETIIPKKDSVKELPKDTSLTLIKPEEKAIAPQQTIAKATDSIKKDTLIAQKNSAPKTVVANTNCKIMATDYDVDKLRVKMLAAENEDDKILAARKIFRTKCFTTNQVKALSEVFPTDEGRYRLFDTAYPFVSDYANYSQLSVLLTSKYYSDRFNVMIKQ